MFSRVFLDTKQWRVSVNMLGTGSLRAVNQSGDSVKASAAEKKYFMQVLAALRKAAVPINAESPVVAAVATDFAKAIHQRFRRSTATGGFAYAVFFSTYSPAQTARNYLEKFQGPRNQTDD